MQSNPLLERIFAAVEGQETKGNASDWRQRIEAASADEKETVIAQAVREVVGSVLRVKPETLRDDQPLTDLGLDSLMGVEIENSLEAAIGVALPPTSLMRARQQPQQQRQRKSRPCLPRRLISTRFPVKQLIG
jgi:acyl carrier protein